MSDDAKVYRRGVIIVSLLVVAGFVALDWRQASRTDATLKAMADRADLTLKTIMETHRVQLEYISIICGNRGQQQNQSVTVEQKEGLFESQFRKMHTPKDTEQ